MSRDPVRFGTIPREVNHVAVEPASYGSRPVWAPKLGTRALCDRRYRWAARPGEPITCPVCIELVEHLVRLGAPPPKLTVLPGARS